MSYEELGKTIEFFVHAAFVLGIAMGGVVLSTVISAVTYIFVGYGSYVFWLPIIFALIFGFFGYLIARKLFK